MLKLDKRNIEFMKLFSNCLNFTKKRFQLKRQQKKTQIFCFFSLKEWFVLQGGVLKNSKKKQNNIQKSYFLNVFPDDVTLERFIP